MTVTHSGAEEDSTLHGGKLFAKVCGWWVGGPLVPSPCTSIVYTLTHMRMG